MWGSAIFLSSYGRKHLAPDGTGGTRESITRQAARGRWPSFRSPIKPERIRTEQDSSWFMQRTESCARRATHISVTYTTMDRGGLRHCTNSTSLKFENSREIRSVQPGLGIMAR